MRTTTVVPAKGHAVAHPRGFYSCVEGVAFTRPCLVMEWVEGEDLRSVINAGAPALVERLGWVRDIADALAALHSATRTSGNPMLHRDVKPENVIVSPERGAVLVDLGTLRPLDDGRDPMGRHSRHYAATDCAVPSGSPTTWRPRWHPTHCGARPDRCGGPTELLARAGERQRRRLRGTLVAAVAGAGVVGLVTATVPEALGVPWLAPHPRRWPRSRRRGGPIRRSPQPSRVTAWP